MGSTIMGIFILILINLGTKASLLEFLQKPRAIVLQVLLHILINLSSVWV
jgi:hypothetical protein